jgi:hypothetical protein
LLFVGKPAEPLRPASESDVDLRRTSHGTADPGLGMAPGTSPAIVKYLSGYVVTYQASNTLWVYTLWGGAWTKGLPMAPNTSPSVASLPNGSFEVAYQGSNGHLFIYTPETGQIDLGVAMAPGTSPDIAN